MTQADSKNTTAAPVDQTRRRFLSQAASVAAGGSVLAMAVMPPALAANAPAGLAGPDAELNALWLEREKLIVASNEVLQRLNAAQESLPAWANHGPAELDCDGNKCGAVVGWPEIPNVPESSGGRGVLTTIRPSPYDIRKLFRLEADVFGRESGPERDEVVRRFRARMRALIKRQREQNDLEISLGIPGMHDRLEDLNDRRFDIEERILELAPSTNQALAASIIDAGRNTLTGCTAGEPTEEFVGVFRLARGLRSQTTHAIRATIDRIFDNPETTLEDLNVLPS